MRIMPRLDQPDNIELTRADPLRDADVLVVDGSRVEYADSDGVEVTVSTDGGQHRAVKTETHSVSGPIALRYADH